MNAETRTLVRSGLDASGYVAGARQIEQANQRITASGEAAAKAHERIGRNEAQAGQQSGRVSEQATQAVNSRRSAIQRLEETLDRTIAQQRRFEAAERTANSAVERGLRTRAEADATIARARAHYLGAGTDAAASSGKVAHAVQQAGLQIGDFAVQVANGGNVVTALSQQLPQLLGAFGAFGAVGGVAVAVLGGVWHAMGAGKTEAERFEEALGKINDRYTDTIDRAQRMTDALVRQNAQYASAAVAGAAYRAGLREEAANLVRLTDYYARLTPAQRGVANRATDVERSAIMSRGRGLINEGSGPLGGVTSLLDGNRSPLDAAGGFVDTTVLPFAENLRRAVDAEREFRESGVLTEDSVSQLVLRLRELNTGTGETARAIERSASAWEAILPRVREYDEALRRLGITQTAINNSDPALVALERGRTVASEVGGAFQTRQRLQRQQQDLRGMLNAPGATADDRRAARSSLAQIAADMVGLTPATEQFLRGLRQQHLLSQHAAGAARELAQAEQQVDEAARSAGRGTASAAERAEARRLTQLRLNETLGESVDKIERAASQEERMAAAYQNGNREVQASEALHQAENDALQFGALTTNEYAEAVVRLSDAYLRLSEARRTARDQQEMAEQRRTIDSIRAESNVTGWSARERSAQFAAIRERHRILASEGDPDSETGRQRIATARIIAELDQDAQDVADVARGMGAAFSTAFESIQQGGAKSSEVLRQLERDLLRLGNQKLIAEPLMGAFSGVLQGVMGGGGGGGGGGGSFSAGKFFETLVGGVAQGGAKVMHSGGMVGADSFPTRAVPAALFAGAPRFHDGGWPGLNLGPDEVPIIAQRGERMLNRQEARDYPRRRSGGDTFVFNFPDADPAKFRRSMGQAKADATRASARGNRDL